MHDQDQQREESSDFSNIVNAIRREIKQIAAEVNARKIQVTRGQHITSAETGEAEAARENRGEVLANLTLAYRHLEDASMRMGKAIQAHNGGTSVYDRASTVGA